MTNLSPSIKNILEGIVPITRFNRGEAGKIFDEVSETGVKVVLKNNLPVAVLITPEQYEAMVETLEDYGLYLETENRLKNAGAQETVSHEQMMKVLGINKAEFNDIDVDIE
jgi:antitoxin StbD